MFTTLIVQPIFNLLVFIYAIIPGHNFGLAIILFTILVRLLMWPLVKKQLNQAKAMRKLRPEIKKIKKAAKGDRRKESKMLMELYKERGVSPFSSLGPIILQLPIFIGLYSGLTRIVNDQQQIVDFAYSWIQDMSWMQQLAANIDKFDATFFGIVDLTRSALSSTGVYWPAMIIVVASVVVQYFQAKQLMPDEADARSLRAILRDASKGKQAEQDELNAAIGRSTRILLPAMVFIFTVHIASALSLYWLVSGLVAYIQQSIVLNKDEDELEKIANEPDKKKVTKKTKLVKDDAEAPVENEAEAAVVTKPKKKKPAKKQRKKRRK